MIKINEENIYMKVKLYGLFTALTIVALIAGTAFYIHEKKEPYLRFTQALDWNTFAVS